MRRLRIVHEPESHKPVGVILREAGIVPIRVARPGGGSVIIVNVADHDCARTEDVLNDSGFEIDLVEVA